MDIFISPDNKLSVADCEVDCKKILLKIFASVKKFNF